MRASVGAAGCKRVEGFVSRGNDVENRVSGQTSYETTLPGVKAELRDRNQSFKWRLKTLPFILIGKT